MVFFFFSRYPEYTAQSKIFHFKTWYWNQSIKTNQDQSFRRKAWEAAVEEPIRSDAFCSFPHTSPLVLSWYPITDSWSIMRDLHGIHIALISKCYIIFLYNTCSVGAVTVTVRLQKWSTSFCQCATWFFFCHMMMGFYAPHYQWCHTDTLRAIRHYWCSATVN